MKMQIVKGAGNNLVITRCSGESVGAHATIGVQDKDGSKSIPVQVSPNQYMLVCVDHVNAPNRRNSLKFAGTVQVARWALDEGETVYIFDTPKELLEWWIS